MHYLIKFTSTPIYIYWHHTKTNLVNLFSQMRHQLWIRQIRGSIGRCTTPSNGALQSGELANANYRVGEIRIVKGRKIRINGGLVLTAERQAATKCIYNLDFRFCQWLHMTILWTSHVLHSSTFLQ